MVVSPSYLVVRAECNYKTGIECEVSEGEVIWYTLYLTIESLIVLRTDSICFPVYAAQI